MTPLMEGVLTGVTAAASGVIALYFLRFWRRSHDRLFAAFAIAFFLKVFDDVSVIGLAHPGNGTWWTHSLRLVESLLILAAIVGKNFG